MSLVRRLACFLLVACAVVPLAGAGWTNLRGPGGGTIESWDDLGARVGGPIGSDPEPPGIANLVHWYRGSDLSLADSSLVGDWPSTGTDTTPVTQSTSTEKPSFIASVTSMGGRSAVDFGGNDWLQSAVTTTISQPYTLCLVYEVQGAVTTNVIIDGIASTARSEIFEDGDSTINILAGTGADSALSPGASGQLACVCADLNGSSSSVTVNGTASGALNAGTHSNTGTTLGSYFGGGAHYTGMIFETATYNTTVSHSEFCDTYAKSYYGVSSWPVTP